MFDVRTAQWLYNKKKNKHRTLPENQKHVEPTTVYICKTMQVVPTLYSQTPEREYQHWNKKKQGMSSNTYTTQCLDRNMCGTYRHNSHTSTIQTGHVAWKLKMTKKTQVITTHKNQKKEIYIPRAPCLFQFDNLCHLKVSQILCSPPSLHHS